LMRVWMKSNIHLLIKTKKDRKEESIGLLNHARYFTPDYGHS